MKKNKPMNSKGRTLPAAEGDIRTPGALLACNEQTVGSAMDWLAQQQPFEKRVEAVKRIFEEHKAANQVDAARMPTKLRGQFVARLQNELMVDLIGQQFCAMDTIQYGESYEYSTVTRTALPIYKMSEPGGKPKSIGWSNAEGLVYLDTPITYTTEEFAIQKFNRNAPERWLREMDRAVTWANQDLQGQLDTDIWTTLASQLVTSALDTDGFSYKNSRVKNIPTANDVNDSAQGSVTKQLVQDAIMFGTKTRRRLVRIVLPAPAMEGVWDWVEADTYAPRISQELMAQIERTGGTALSLWGNTVIFQPTNVLEGTSGSRYVYCSYEPLDPIAVPGACFYVQAQMGSEGDAYDFLEFQRREGGYDVFVAQASVIIAAIGWQKPNIARFRYV